MNSDLLMFFMFLTPAAVTLIWPIRLMLTRKPVLTAQWLMGLFQLLSAVCIIFYAAHYFGIISHEFIGDIMFKIVAIFVYPTFYIYICSLTNVEGVKRKDRCFAYLFPFAYLIFYCVISYYVSAEKYDLFSQAIIHHDFRLLPLPSYKMLVVFGYYGFHVVALIQIVLTVIIGTIKLRGFHRRIEEFNPALVVQKQACHWLMFFAVLSMIVVYGVLFIGVPTRASMLGLLYISLMLYAAAQYILGQFAYDLDMSASQIDEVERKMALKRKEGVK